jgi:uncharacterized protein
MTGRRRALVVIAKEPVPGAVKTRLAPFVGVDGAARVAAAMLADTVAVMTQVEAEPWVCFAPPDARGRMARLVPRCGRRTPRSRAISATAGRLLRGAVGRQRRTGGDRRGRHPARARATCEAAFALLDHVEVVLGPAEDGGYYLVGAKAALPELFVGVPMGAQVVLQVTIQRAVRRRLRIATVPTLPDLDRLEDLRAALAAVELDGSPRTRTVATDLLAVRPAAPRHR